jgi:hypothetical protein
MGVFAQVECRGRRIVFDRALCDQLDDAGLEALAGHELAHVLQWATHSAGTEEGANSTALRWGFDVSQLLAQQEALGFEAPDNTTRSRYSDRPTGSGRASARQAPPATTGDYVPPAAETPQKLTKQERERAMALSAGVYNVGSY